MAKNLVFYCSVFRDGEGWIVVETGMPEDNVRVGAGDTLREAYDSRDGTPIQSVGRDSGLAAALSCAGYDAVNLEEEEDAILLEDNEEGEDNDPPLCCDRRCPGCSAPECECEC